MAKVFCNIERINKLVIQNKKINFKFENFNFSKKRILNMSGMIGPFNAKLKKLSFFGSRQNWPEFGL